MGYIYVLTIKTIKMANEVTLGGDRLGAGKKMKVGLKNYERSTHNLSYVWRSTMSAGTLVPFMNEVALPGDTFDIKLDCDIKTHPTIGPLFGSYKIQLDVFQCPIRLYQGQLHNNKLGIGMKMANVKLPIISMVAKNITEQTELDDNAHINASCIFSYLGIRGLGRSTGDEDPTVQRAFNAVPYIAYADIYKNYYANKQEEVGAVIHSDPNITENIMNIASNRTQTTGSTLVPEVGTAYNGLFEINNLLGVGTKFLQVQSTEISTIKPDISNLQFRTYSINNQIQQLWVNATDYCRTITTETIGQLQLVTQDNVNELVIDYWRYNPNGGDSTEPSIEFFPLENLDEMREKILMNQTTTPVAIVADSLIPYSLPLKGATDNGVNGKYRYSKQYSQEGLFLKTYQSDLFNNWLSTEWIDGDNGISAITAIDTTDGNFTIDTLNLSNKVYNMLNRIAVSGGSYDDWVEAVYDNKSYRKCESPMYLGGLSKELIFQEVISNSAAASDGTTQPLGTLAGRGTVSNKHKGGYISVKVDEPSYIMGIISLTPRIDYSQGNKWDVNLMTMDDFHKPALDEIGFQDLVTDQMAWWDTVTDNGIPSYKSAGKQPAWLNYMTNVNQVRGNFAFENNEMFMVLNRKYEWDADNKGIKDLTTYIDPAKYNNIFAYTKLDGQNFWAQVGLDITARRKMSARIMPNL